MANREWYIAKGNGQIGPVSEDTVIELIRNGEIGQNTLVWHSSYENWEPAGGLHIFQEFFPTVAALPSDKAAQAPPNTNKQNKPSSNYLIRHWRGDLSLGVSWWVNGFLLNIFLTIIDLSLAESDVFENPVAALVYILTMIAIYTWQIVGIWKSAENYIRAASTSADKKSGGLGRMAQFFTVVGLINTVVTMSPIIQDTINLISASNSDIANRYYIQLSGSTDVLLNGYINQDSIGELISTFDNNKERTGLVLNSPGGLLVSAFSLADYIRQNNIVVAANGECVSACVFLLASANISAASVDSELIFHHPEELVEFRSQEMKAEVLLEEHEYYKRLVEYGVNSRSLEEFRKTDFTPLTLAEAYRIGIIDYIWDTTTNVMHDPKEFCNDINCSAAPTQFVESSATNQLSVYDLQPGICFDKPNGGSITNIGAIPCNLPHDYEVVGSYEINDPELPNAEVLIQRCIPLFEPYVGLSYIDSDLYLDVFYPILESFELGERDVDCLVYIPDSKIERSAREGNF